MRLVIELALKYYFEDPFIGKRAKWHKSIPISIQYSDTIPIPVQYKYLKQKAKMLLVFGFPLYFNPFVVYSDKLAHVQVIINSPYFVAQMCTREDVLAHNFSVPCIDDVMSNLLTTL